tara:strand:- start:75 stop:923 length:849 start_codon:yes stop_codon:yes gene_type:complete
MLALEIRQRGELDGASSVGSERQRRPVKDKRRAKARRRDYDDDDDDDDDEEEEGDDVDEDEDEDEDDAGSGILAGAAFGSAGSGDGAGKGKKRGRGEKKKKGVGNKDGDSCASCSVESDNESAVSATSSMVKAARKRAFPVPGVNCVGCALPAKVVLIDEFVQKNCDRMQEQALFKMAALMYITKVANPASEEGLAVPSWGWKEIRGHYQLHKVDARYQRFENIRTLGAMRKTLEMQLMRENDDGELLLDKNHAEQIMKVITLSSRELSLLHETNSAGKPKK